MIVASHIMATIVFIVVHQFNIDHEHAYAQNTHTNTNSHT